MASVDMQDRVERFDAFFRTYYEDDIAELAQHYPTEERSLWIDWSDLYRFDEDLAEDIRTHPEQLLSEAEEALRLFDLPVDVSLGQAHVRLRDLPFTTPIRDIRSDHVNQLVAVRGIVRKSTGVKPQIIDAGFECQRCGTLNRIPQQGGTYQEPHQCQGCERKGPFRLDEGQSTFVDAQRLRIQESPEGLRGGETPESIDIHIEDDITGGVSPGDNVLATGILRLAQQSNSGEESTLFDVFMDGVAIEHEEEQFDEMDITKEDEAWIIEQSERSDLYERMVDSIAPSIYGYEEAKLAMVLQLFSGVTKELKDGSRTRGDTHMLFIGDPGTGKCQRYDTPVSLVNGEERLLGDIVEEHLEHPIEVDDGYYASTELPVLTVEDGNIRAGVATRVWKREAPAELYRIRTDQGRTVEITPSHPLFVSTGGQLTPVPARELAVDTWVAVPASMSNSGIDVIPNVGEQISSIRSQLQLTDADCGIASERLQAIERGDRHPTRAELDQLTRTFETTLAGGKHIQEAIADGGTTVQDNAIASAVAALRNRVESDVRWDRIETIDRFSCPDEWVYDLEVAGTHNYLAGGFVSHNSALLQYIRNIAPRSVYTSGKGSSAAGLTAAAVRDDFGDGSQWSLEAGALVLADKGIAAIDELDKMRCITGDSGVHLGDGRVRKIADLAAEGASTGDIEVWPNGRTIRSLDIEAWTMTDDGDLVTRPVTAIHEYEAPTELVSIELTSGESIRTTADHPVIVREDGEHITRPASEVGEHDWAVVPKTLPRPISDGGTCSTAPSGNRLVTASETNHRIPASKALISTLQTKLRLPNQNEAFDSGGSLPQSRAIELVETCQERREQAAKHAETLENNNANWRRLKAYCERYEISTAELADRLDCSASAVSDGWGTDESLRNELSTAIQELLATIAGVDLSGLKTLVESDIAWAQVAAVRSIDSHDASHVYDLTVDGTHNYVANGIVVHNSEDRSALHEGLEAQEISISKAGINATLKARCSLLGAANPRYGRFDQYEPMGEQIDLEPALISRFDLIFMITDEPDEEEDRRLARHILEKNYAGELNTRRTKLRAPDVTESDVDEASKAVTPPIDPEQFRKYVAFAKQSCYPQMNPEAMEAIENFYVDLRSRGTGDDAPVPVTARKLEALVRLSEASARVRLSDTVELEDAHRVIDLVRSCLQDIGVDPETGQYDADVIETGQSKTQRDRVRSLKEIIRELQKDHQEGAPRETVLEQAESAGIDRQKAEHQIQKLRDMGEVYSPQGEHLRVV